VSDLPDVMTWGLDGPDDEEPEVEVGVGVEVEVEGSEATAATMRSHELWESRTDLQANDLAGKSIGQWTVVGHKKNEQARNVYVLRHEDGFLKGVRGYVLNRMLIEAQRNGLA
jgi:hypothetical protein